jgi:hypothetical protein
MGNINQEIINKHNTNFDELMERLFSLNIPDREKLIKENELQLIQGFSDLFNVVGDKWNELKNGRFERFLFEIFDSALRKTVLAKTLYKFSIEKNLRDMQYLWYLAGVFTNDFKKSIHPLIDLVLKMTSEPITIEETSFIDSWWWDGGDCNSVLREVLSKQDDLYEFYKHRESQGIFLSGFDDYIVCNLYANKNVCKTTKAPLGEHLIKMLTEFSMNNIEDIFTYTYGRFNGFIVALTKVVIDLEENNELLLYNPNYLDPICNNLREINSDAEKYGWESPFTGIIISNQKEELAEILYEMKDKFPNSPLISTNPWTFGGP